MPTNEAEAMEQMSEMMMEQFKMQDQIHEQEGCENEDFEEALMYYVSKDPEVQARMRQYMMAM